MLGLKRSAGYPPGIRVALVGLLVSTACSPAYAADWSIVYKNDTTLTLTDNIFGTVVGRKKTAGLEISKNQSVDILAKTKTDLWRLTPTLSSSADFYADSTFDPQHLPGISGEYSHNGKLTTFSANAYFNYSDASASDIFRNIIILQEEGTQLSYGGSLAFGRKLTKRDSVSWNNSYSTIRYQDIKTLEPTESLSSNLSWIHNLSPLYTATVSGTVTYTNPSPFLSPRNAVTGRPNPVDPATGLPRLVQRNPNERMTYQGKASLDAKLTKRLTAVGSIGISLIDEQGAPLANSLIYALSATYNMKNTAFTGGFSRNFSVNNDGDNEETYDFNLGMSHNVNDLTSWGVTANYVFSPKPGDLKDTTGLFITPYLSYKPAKDWNTKLSYQYANTDEDNEHIIENSVLFTVSYNKTLLP
jgi:hypothetical protein